MQANPVLPPQKVQGVEDEEDMELPDTPTALRLLGLEKAPDVEEGRTPGHKRRRPP